MRSLSSDCLPAASQPTSLNNGTRSSARCWELTRLPETLLRHRLSGTNQHQSSQFVFICMSTRFSISSFSCTGAPKKVAAAMTKVWRGRGMRSPHMERGYYWMESVHFSISQPIMSPNKCRKSNILADRVPNAGLLYRRRRWAAPTAGMFTPARPHTLWSPLK